MSGIELTGHQGPTGRPLGRSRSESRQTGLNNAMAVALIAILALAPLFFGSVHAFSWGFFAAATGLLGAIYAAVLAFRGQAARIPVVSLAWLSLPFAVVCLYLVIQMLPVANILGVSSVASAGGLTLQSRTISIAPDMTLLMLVRQLTYAIFFYLVLQVAANEGRRRLMIRGMLLIVMVYGAWGVISLQSGDSVLGVPKTAYLGSATGPFVNRNSFATFLAFGAVIALCQVGRRIVAQLERHQHDGRIAGNASAISLYGMSYLLLMAVVVATQSRMGLFSAMLGSMVVVTAVLIRAVRMRFGAVLLIGIIIAAVAGGMLLFGESILERLVSTQDSASGRGDLYRQVLGLIALRPWTGFGGGSFEVAFPLVHDVPVSLHFMWDKAHNTYLTLWAELGLVVGSLPVLAFGLLAYRLLRHLMTPSAGWASATIALAVLVVGGAHSLVDFSLEIQANSLFFVALIATGLASFDPNQR